MCAWCKNFWSVESKKGDFPRVNLTFDKEKSDIIYVIVDDCSLCKNLKGECCWN